MGYFLRYADEIRDAGEYFCRSEACAKWMTINSHLAKELIKQEDEDHSIRSKFTDDYEVALRELVDAKLKHIPLPKQQAAPRGKVIDLMDALRRSVKEPPEKKKPVARAGVSAAKVKPGPRLIQSNAKAADKRRKSA
jgi:DNA end-binding protein Ku